MWDTVQRGNSADWDSVQRGNSADWDSANGYSANGYMDTANG